MNLTVIDNLTLVAPASAAAVVALIPTNTCSIQGAGCSDRELDPAQADALVSRLLDITGGGPLAFLVTHDEHAWADCFKRHGLATTTGLFLLDSFGVVVGSAGPTKLPDETFFSLGELVRAVTALVSNPGDCVVVPYAFMPTVSIAVASMDREAIAVAQSATHALYLRTSLAGEVQTADITDDQYSAVLRRLSEGESASSIARSLGIVGDRLCRRLEKDGIRAHRKRGKVKAEGPPNEQADGPIACLSRRVGEAE